MLFNTTDKIYNKFEDIIVYFITIPTLIGMILATTNALILARYSRYWYQMRNKAEYINDANHKTATMNCVKYGLCTVVLVSEVVIDSLLAAGDFLHHLPCDIAHQYQIECGIESFIHQLVNSAIISSLIIPLSVVSMLSLFMVKVIANSEVDTGLLRREAWLTFWLSIIAFTICSIGLDTVTSFGVIFAKIIHLYLCWVVYKGMKKLFITLKSRCLDYTFEPDKFEFHRRQVRHYKWSSLIVGISCGGFVVSNSVLRIHESIGQLYLLMYYRQSYFSLEMSAKLSDTPSYELVHYVLVLIERLFFVNWGFISMGLNLVLLITFVRQALWYRRAMSVPFHVKMMGRENGRIMYKRVAY